MRDSTIETKLTPFAIDVKGGKPSVRGRTFTGLASTGDLDLGGDIVEPSAFEETISRWRKTGSLIPLLDSHDGHESINRVLGKLVEAEVRSEGLWTAFELVDTPTGDEALQRVKGGYVTGLSIGYRPITAEDLDGEIRVVGGSPIPRLRRITKIDLREVSLVVWPMNPAALVETRGLAVNDPHRMALEAALRKRVAGGALAPDDPRRIAADRRLARIRSRVVRDGHPWDNFDL